MEKCSFFNSINRDRLYKAEDHAEFFSAFIGNGVFPNPSTNLQAIANNNMTVTLKQGKAWINGYFYFNTDDLILSVDAADGVLNRIDRLVIRLDTVNREIKAKIKKGAFASTPVAPVLQRDADAYELAIANIYIGAGAVSATQANITDVRLDANVCGLVSGTVEQVDVTTLFNQYNEGFQLKESEFEQEFQDWFNNVKSQLSGDVAANLQAEIDALQSSISETNSSLGNIQAELNNLELVDTAVQITDANNHFASITLDGVLDELFTNANDGKTAVANAVTAKGVTASSSDTFSALATKIGQIKVGKYKEGDLVSFTRIKKEQSNLSIVSFSANESSAYYAMANSNIDENGILYITSGTALYVIKSSSDITTYTMDSSIVLTSAIFDNGYIYAISSVGFKKINYAGVTQWIIPSITGGSNMCMDDDFIYVNQNNSIHKIRKTDGQVVASLLNANAVEIARVKNKLIYKISGSTQINIVDTATLSSISTLYTTLTDTITYMNASSDGLAYILFASSSLVYRFYVDTINNTFTAVDTIDIFGCTNLAVSDKLAVGLRGATGFIYRYALADNGNTYNYSTTNTSGYSYSNYNVRITGNCAYTIYKRRDTGSGSYLWQHNCYKINYGLTVL